MKADDFLPGEAVIAGIRADIERYEAERRRVHRSVRWRVPVFDGLTLIAVLAIAYLLNGIAHPQEQWISLPHIILYIFAILTLIYMHWSAVAPARKLQQSLRDRIIPVVFGFIENISYRHQETPDSFKRLPQEVLETFNRQEFDDVLSGRHDDFPFELYEVELRNKAGRSNSQVFKGVVVAFETVSPFPGLLVAGHKTRKVTGFFRGLFGGDKLREIQSGNPELDDAYAFRTDNVEAAQPLVTGRLAQALLWLHETWPEAPSRLALRGNDGFLLIPQQKNFFELPGISQSLDYRVHVQPMIADMAALLATGALVRKAGWTGDVPSKE